MDRRDYIKLLRSVGFNCFPIPAMQKEADGRYKAKNTEKNQLIKDDENYGYIPIEGAGTAIVDIDSKHDSFTPLIDKLKEKYMVIETGKGYHIPVRGISGEISKTELFNYSISKDKIVEIQGTKHYCVGVGSKIWHKKLDKEIIYINIGKDEIFSVKDTDFHDFIDKLCVDLSITKKSRNKEGHYYLRQKFKEGKPPSHGESNDYFFNASLYCNSEGFSIEEATQKIHEVYVKWQQTPDFSGRDWNNVLSKINEVYSNNRTIKKGRPKGSQFDRTEIAKELKETRKLYKNDKEIWENKNGFLEIANMSLKEYLTTEYPEIEEVDFNSVIFKLSGLLPALPKTNKDLIVFKNGTFSQKENDLVNTEEIADIGFSDYDYIPNCPRPEKFYEIMFGNIPVSDHPRVKAGLKAIFKGNLDSRISVIHGQPSTGKSTGLTILVMLLKEYGFTVELDQLLTDKFIRAKIQHKRLVVLQDLPIDWKDFAQLKTLTGESVRTERGFMQDSSQFESKMKFWASGNYLAKIPEKEKDAMYARRLSLIHNTRTEPYKENPSLINNIIEQEGEQIISWILQLDDGEYEPKDVIRNEWENLSSPEIAFINQNYEVVEDSSFHEEMGVIRIKNKFEETMGLTIDINTLEKTLKNHGYSIRNMIIKNIRKKDEGKLG